MTKAKNPDPHDNLLEKLSGILRGLRLRNMAEELPGVLQEGAREGWGQLELLWELFHREDVRKRQSRYERNLKASGLDECYGLDHFDFKLAREHGLDEGIVRDLAQCEFVKACRVLPLKELE